MSKPVQSLAVLAVAAGSLMLAGAATAAPATYKIVVDRVTGSIDGAAVGPNATVTITLVGDTTTVESQTIGAGPANCVTGPGSIAISGGVTRTFASGAAYICARVDGQQVGFYPALGSFSSPIHGGNGSNGTGSLVGAPLSGPGITLTSNFGPVSYQTDVIHSHGASVALIGGGTYSASTPEFGPNTAASLFQVQVVPEPVPTMSEWAMILFGLILAGGAALYVQRRQATI